MNSRFVFTKLMLSAMAVFVFCFCGCSDSSNEGSKAGKKLIGVWEGQFEAEVSPGDSNMTLEGPASISAKFEFKQDGTMTMDIPFLGPASGTWALIQSEGNKLTIKTVMEIPSIEMSFEEHVEGSESSSEESVKIETESEEQTFSVIFETDDRITMAPQDTPDEAITLHRTPEE